MPVLVDVLPLWKIPLDGSIGGVPVSMKPLDEDFGLWDSGEAGRGT